MKKSYFVAISISLVLVLIVIIAGCVQYPSNEPSQSGTNTATTGQTYGQSGVQTGSPGTLPATTPASTSSTFTVTTPNTGITISGSTQRVYPHNSYVVSIIAYRNNPSSITVYYQGGQDASKLWSINIYVNDVFKEPMIVIANTALPVGTHTIVTATNPGNDRIDCVGHYSDGTQGLIYEATL